MKGTAAQWFRQSQQINKWEIIETLLEKVKDHSIETDKTKVAVIPIQKICRIKVCPFNLRKS
jgi:hypothetical protein